MDFVENILDGNGWLIYLARRPASDLLVELEMLFEHGGVFLKHGWFIKMSKVSTGISLAFSALFLTACGGGSSSGGTPTPTTSLNGGTGVTGPWANASVTAYKLDLTSANRKGAVIDTGSTDGSARMTGLDIPTDTVTPFVLEITVNAGTIDISSGAAPLISTLRTAVTDEMLNTSNPVYLTAHTTMAVNLATSNADQAGGGFSGNGDGSVTLTEWRNALNIASSHVVSTFGFGMSREINIFTTPAMIDNSTTTTENQRKVAVYRAAVEALSAVLVSMKEESSASNNASRANADDMLEGLSNDLADGVIDGQIRGTAISAFADITDVATSISVDPSFLMIPGTETPINNVPQILADETETTGATTDTSRFIDGSITVNPVSASNSIDSDADGVINIDDAFPNDPTESIDTDNDGIGNNRDTDDDNDGVEDSADAFPLDPTESIDTDNDGIGNNRDTDDDNDGVEDIVDALPLDPTESIDTDNDGIGNNRDTDDDNDSVEDSADAFPLDSSEILDTDTDGVGNNQDLDDDNDGIADVDDPFPQENRARGNNSAPVPNTASITDSFAGATVFLDGNPSFDPESDALDFHWSIATSPENSSAIMQASNSATPFFIPDEPGIYEILMYVSDGSLTSSTSFNVNILSAQPTALTGNDHNVTAGATVTLNGDTSLDPQGLPLTYRWKIISQPDSSQLVEGETTTSIINVIPDVNGVYVFSLVVNNGLYDSDEELVTINVKDDAEWLEVKFIITNSIMSSYADWSVPAMNGLSCGVEGSGSLSGYTWRFQSCQVYGDAGNPVSAVIVNHNTQKGYNLLSLVGMSCLSEGCGAATSFLGTGVIGESNRYIPPNSYWKFQMNLRFGSEISDGWVAFDVENLGAVNGIFSFELDRY